MACVIIKPFSPLSLYSLSMGTVPAFIFNGTEMEECCDYSSQMGCVYGRIFGSMNYSRIQRSIYLVGITIHFPRLNSPLIQEEP